MNLNYGTPPRDAENAYAANAESYLVAKEQKRKNIAKIVKAEKAKGTIRI
jgi:hypothetical protein